MAEMTLTLIKRSIRLALVASTLASTGALAGAASLPPEVPDPAAINAFKEYWSAFESYEDKLVDEGQRQFRKSWDEVKKSYDRDYGRISDEQLNALQKAAAKYRRHLEDHASAENRPYVMLNLAQILGMIGDHLAKSDENAGTFTRNEALTILRDLTEQYANFPYREQAGYLRAVILESLDRQDDALAAWQTLAASAKATIYGVHARIAVGDHMWQRERAAEAMKAYQRALELLPDVNSQDAEYERLRINYRLAWAASRAAEVNVVVQAAAELLTPGRHSRSADQREKIQQDAVELMGDALYENNVMSRTKEVLRRKDIAAFAAAVGLRTATRYNLSGIHAETTDLGEFLAEEFPLAKEAPQILQVTADSWSKLGKTPRRIAVLERLGLLLPEQSLWRSRYKDDPKTIRAMEAVAKPAAAAVAAAHYDTGLAAGNVKAFATAASFYEILLGFEANGSDSNSWRLRVAHCRYFSGEYEDAAKLYTTLKSEYKIDGETLQVASYQLVLTNERRWRENFAKAVEKSQDPLKDAKTGAALAALGQSIDEFAARFPSQGRSVDLLLVGASANRDMERFVDATKYWQRALVSQPSAAQRGIAIRGLVFASMKDGSAGDVVELVRRFLKLEDWRALGLNLGNELRGVLSAAALDEGKRLNDSGKVMEAGHLLTQIADEFTDLPDRDRIYRDGAYMLAIAGDWARAQKASEGYFKAGLLRNRADMTYLLARAHEYQIRLHDAAVKYLELGEKYPRHTRANTSLQRAEKLALAEGDYALAAQAAGALGEQAKSEPDRLQHYSRAVDHMEKADNPDKALSLAKKRMRTAKTPAERLRSQLLVARMTYLSGSEQEALDEMDILAKSVERSRNKLGPQEYASIAGEVNFQLAEEARRKFDDFRIAERGGAITSKLEEKTRYFEDLVSGYDKAAAAGDPKWAARSRFQLAISAQAFADEIAGIPNKTEENLSLRSQNRYKSTVERLQAMARKYHSSNVLAAQKDPGRYKDNEWVEKSSLRLTGAASQLPTGARRREVIPTAVQDNMPMQWSL